MPNLERRGGLRGLFRGRAHPDAKAITIPENPVVETPHPKELSLEETAERMRNIFRDTIKDLGVFPHGIIYTDKIFMETNKSSIGRHGQETKIIATVTDQGEIVMFNVTERVKYENRGHGEWDLDSGTSWNATDQEVIDYAIPLMAMVKIRSANARIKAIGVDQAKPGILHDGEETVKQTMDAVNIEVAMQRLSRLEPAA